MTGLPFVVWVPAALFADQVSSSWERYLLGFGPLGVWTLLMVLGYLESPKRADKAEARAEAEAKARSDLEEVFRKEVVPAMTRFTEVATRILDRDMRQGQ